MIYKYLFKLLSSIRGIQFAIIPNALYLELILII